MSFGLNTTVIAVVTILVAFVAMGGFIASRLRTVPSNEVLIVVGKGLGGKSGSAAGTAAQDQVYFSGRALVLPVLQKAFTLSLKQRQVPLNVTGQDKNFIKVNVVASINFKFADSEEDVRKAAQRFLTHSDAELHHSIQQSVEGSLRSIVGSMTIEDINSNRAQFQNEVLSSAKAELADQGIHIDVLNISDIQTPGSTYLEDLAKPEAARVRQIAAVKESEARQASEFARIQTETNVAEKDKDLKIKVAGFQAETDRQQAVADAAGQLSKAEQDVSVAKLEREALTERALVEAERLDITQKKPADAAAYAARVKAEGERDAAKAKAEGEAYQKTTMARASKEATVLEATGKAESVKLEANADAEATSVKGLSEAKSIEAVGAAKASAAEARAKALNGYDSNALTFELAARLPEIVRAAAEPMSNIDNYTVISTDGASDATKQVGNVITELPALIKSATGIDIMSVVAGMAGGKVAAGHSIEASAPASAKEDALVG
ncbi:flotillin family protein [Arthrobacter methylotrophus]|uniref:Flotillin family protein n=1 Tax=Arthrobacter methylotrophus TaxID=121291 RepID=A0ABV5UPI2_9MICC